MVPVKCKHPELEFRIWMQPLNSEFECNPWIRTLNATLEFGLWMQPLNSDFECNPFKTTTFVKQISPTFNFQCKFWTWTSNTLNFNLDLWNALSRCFVRLFFQSQLRHCCNKIRCGSFDNLLLLLTTQFRQKSNCSNNFSAILMCYCFYCFCRLLNFDFQIFWNNVQATNKTFFFISQHTFVWHLNF